MLVIYDVTSGESFVNVKRWLHEIDQNCDNVQRILGLPVPLNFSDEQLTDRFVYLTFFQSETNATNVSDESFSKLMPSASPNN